MMYDIDEDIEVKKVRDYLFHIENTMLGYLDQIEEVVNDELFVPHTPLVFKKIREIKQLCISSYKFEKINLETIKTLQIITLRSLLVGNGPVVYLELGCQTLFDLLNYHFKKKPEDNFDVAPPGVSESNVRLINERLKKLGINYWLLWQTK